MSQYINGVLQGGGGLALPAASTTLVGTQDNFALAAGVSWLVGDGASSITLTGITGGTAGRLLVVTAGANPVFLNPEAAGSLAANRISNYGGGQLTLYAQQSVVLAYDANLAMWRTITIF